MYTKVHFYRMDKLMRGNYACKPLFQVCSCCFFPDRSEHRVHQDVSQHRRESSEVEPAPSRDKTQKGQSVESVQPWFCGIVLGRMQVSIFPCFLQESHNLNIHHLLNVEKIKGTVTSPVIRSQWPSQLQLTKVSIIF